MRIREILLSMTILAALTAPAAAQSAAPAQGAASGKEENAGPARCFLFGMAFSEGVVVRGGTDTMVCQADSTWAKTMAQAAGCIYESKVYSTGALKALGDARNTVLECLSDGTWSPVPTPKKP